MVVRDEACSVRGRMFPRGSIDITKDQSGPTTSCRAKPLIANKAFGRHVDVSLWRTQDLNLAGGRVPIDFRRRAAVNAN